MPEPNVAARALNSPPTYEVSQFRDRHPSSSEHEAEAAAAARNHALNARPPHTALEPLRVSGSQDQETLRPTSSQPRTNSPMSVADKVTPIKYLDSRAPQWFDCPFCQQRARTRPERKGRSMQVLVGGLLCLFTICLTPLPCLLHWFEETEWFCASCKARVATQVYGGDVIPVPPPRSRFVNSRYSGTMATVVAPNSATAAADAPIPVHTVPQTTAAPTTSHHPTHIAHYMVSPTANPQLDGASDLPPTSIPAPPSLPPQNFIELSTFGPVELPSFPLNRRDTDRSDDSSVISLPIQRPQPAASVDTATPKSPMAPSHVASPSVSTTTSIGSNGSTAVNSLRTASSSHSVRSSAHPDARPDSELLPLAPLPEAQPVELPADPVR